MVWRIARRFPQNVCGGDSECADFQVVKNPTDKMKLVLAINRKPIVKWFKEQIDRLKQNIRQPIQPQKKDKKI